MGLRFRIWMPAIAVLIVLLSIATILTYGLQTVKARLGEYSQDRAVARAAAAASTVSDAGPGDVGQALKLVADAGGGEALFVDRNGEILVRKGKKLLPEIPNSVLQAAANGERVNQTVGERRVASVPVVRGGELRGGVVFVSGESEASVLNIFSRSNLEAGALALVIGGGLMLLVATLLSRRVERLTLGARAIEQGDFSSRIEPGYGDELGDLAETFNSMAGKLQKSFARIEENNQTLGAILNNLREGVLAAGLDGDVVFINRAAREMLGLEASQMPGKVPNPFPDFDLPEAASRCARERECGEARVQSGETFLRVNFEHLPSFDEHRGGVLVVLQDLSEGRRLEMEQQRFLADAAHELKTPITTILGASELLLTEERDDPQVRERFLTHINTEAERMRRLSDTLLRLARTGFDLRNPDLSPVDTESVTRRVAEGMSPLAESSGIAISVEGEGERVRADEEWLEQALLVLVSNAINHSEAHTRITLRLSGNSITVEDEGEGISEADLPRVFERFYRGSGSTRGFGLGLSICKELIERMEGKISVESSPHVGTKMKVELSEVEDG